MNTSAVGAVDGAASPRRAARLGRRVAAYLIDAAVAAVVLLIASGVFGGIAVVSAGRVPLPVAGAAALVVLLAWLLVYTLMQSGAGSVGMRILGLRLARADGGRLGFGAVLARNVVWGLGGLIVVGPFSPLFDASPWHRGWHDRASGTVMTDAAGRGPLVDDDASEAAPEDAPVPFPATGAPVVPFPATDSTPTVATTAPAGGVISVVPGITRSAPAGGATPPAGDVTPGIPVVDAPSPRPPVVAAIVDDPIDQTRLSTGERPRARLVWDDGTRQAVFGRTVFGRNPVAETGATVSPVRDETLSLSKTHFELIPDEDGRALWVIDRHSTNGVLIRRGGEAVVAEPGARTRVQRGDVLEFGDRRVTIQVAP